jgi:hypothetical protein
MTLEEISRLRRIRVMLGEPFDPARFRDLLRAEFAAFLANENADAWSALLDRPGVCRSRQRKSNQEADDQDGRATGPDH